MQLSNAVLGLLMSTSIHAYKQTFKSNATPLAEAFCPPRAASPVEQKSIFNAFVQAFYVDKNVTAAFTNYVAVDYIQHNPFAQSGRQEAIDALAPFVPNTTYTIQRTSFDSDLAWVHTKTEILGQPVAAVVDIFRLNGSCIQEHWDFFQAVPENPINPIAMF